MSEGRVVAVMVKAEFPCERCGDGDREVMAWAKIRLVNGTDFDLDDPEKPKTVLCRTCEEADRTAKHEKAAGRAARRNWASEQRKKLNGGRK